MFNNGNNAHSYQGGPATRGPGANGQSSQVAAPLGWKEMAAKRPRRGRGRQRVALGLMATLLLAALIFAAVRVTAVASATDDQLTVQIGGQQAAQIDLRESFPISPYLLGVNVFPKDRSSSVDKPFSGFMSYDPPVVNGLVNAHVKLLRFPGGNWGESQAETGGGPGHILSHSQMNFFSTLLTDVGADGMIQARLSSPIDGTGQLAPLAVRANEAGRWVDYMNNPKSPQRTGGNAHAPFHPVKFWSVGNEPDRLINPDTGKPFTVAEYVNAFILYSQDMHRNDPTIKVFGPEISQFFGAGAGPFDAQGQLWMEGFLKGVGAYEQAHHVTLLDGVSFHRYQFTDARNIPAMLMSSTDEWNYLLPPLRQMIRQYLGRDVPIAVTELNTNPGGQVPTRGQAALWWADTLGALMNQQVEYVGFFSAEGVDTPYPLFTSNGLHETPMLRVMQMFSHLQPNLVPVDAQREPISLYATQDNISDTVSLLFINKSATPQLAHIGAQNQLFGASPWHSEDISIAGDSLVLVTLHRNGGADAYSYPVPTVNEPTTPPLTFTTCGDKTDPLANNIPC